MAAGPYIEAFRPKAGTCDSGPFISCGESVKADEVRAAAHRCPSAVTA